MKCYEIAAENIDLRHSFHELVTITNNKFIYLWTHNGVRNMYENLLKRSYLTYKRH